MTDAKAMLFNARMRCVRTYWAYCMMLGGSVESMIDAAHVAVRSRELT